MLKKTKKQPLYKKSWKQNLYKNRFIRKSLKDKLINSLMVNGEKSKACKFFNSVVYLLRKKILVTQKTQQNITLLLENRRKDLLPQQKKGSYPKQKFCEFSNNLGLCIHKPLVHTLAGAQKKSLGIEKIPKAQKPPISKQFPHYTLEYLITFSVSKSLFFFLDSIKKKKSPMMAFSLKTFLHLSIENVKPVLEVRKVRKAATTYHVPAIVSKKRQETIAIRWILESAKKRRQNSTYCFAECLAQELLDAYGKLGYARQKREDLYKIAESNRAFIRYRWW